MTIPLSEINEAIDSICDFVQIESQVHTEWIKVCGEDMGKEDVTKSNQDHSEWLADMQKEIADLKAIREIWNKYRSYETERVSEYKKRLWIQFYEDLPEDMKEKINVDKTIDFDYP